MKLEALHNWDLSPSAAIKLQAELAPGLVDDKPLDWQGIRRVAGVDVSVKGGVSRAAVVVMRYPELETIETRRAQTETAFPYIPGLLAFREGPVLLSALGELRNEPDVFIFDGMGQMHPRRMGIAAHWDCGWGARLWAAARRDTLGRIRRRPPRKAAAAHWSTKASSWALCCARAQTSGRFLSLSGHLTDLESAVQLVLTTTTRFRLPQPIRAAHKAASLP